MNSVRSPHAKSAWEELYDVMRREAPFEEKARLALEVGEQYLGADRGLLVRTDTESDHWEAIASTEPSDAKLHEGLELALETTYCRRVIETDSQVTLYDAPNQEWDDDPAFEAHGYHCYLGTPVYLDEEPYGTVCFIGDDPRDEPFTADETLFAELITRLIERELEVDKHTAEITDATNLAAVLARVLRHNIRNSLTVIRAYTREMGMEADDHDYGEIVLRELDTLLELSEKARQLEQILSNGTRPIPKNIVPVIEEVADAVATEYRSASVSVRSPDEVVLPIRPSFERAIEELVENAAQHGGESPSVSVVVESVGDAVEIRIRDDGPGLPQMERTAFETAEPTPLTHGIGLGLWMVRWIITTHGGTVEATVTDEGTTITITLLVAPETEEQTELSEITRARDQYKAAFDEANEAMVVFNDDARLVDVNPKAAEIYGNNRQELLGRKIVEFLPDEYDFASAWATFQETKDDDEGDVQDIVEFIADDGEKRVVECSTVTDIVPGQHLVIMRELTSHRAHSNVYEEIFNQTYQFMGLMRPDGTLLEVNDTALEFGGLTREEVLGEKLWDTIWFQRSETTRERAREAVERAARGEFVRRELNVTGVDREAIIDFSIRPVTDNRENVRLLIPEGRAMTERREDARGAD